MNFNLLASIAAATRLLAAEIACISPVRCKLNSSIGITCEYPPPAAPPGEERRDLCGEGRFKYFLEIMVEIGFT